MKSNFFKLILGAGLVTGTAISCTKDLNRYPTNDITSQTVYSTTTGYKEAFAKVYGAFALTGNQGPAGNGDVQGIDEGFSDYLRLFFNAQELSTDEAVTAWGDAGLQDFHNMNWSASNPFLTGLYYRCYYQITLCNDFIRQSSDANLASRGITGASADSIRTYRAEARFLRALQYWSIVDLFGAGPFVTETDALGNLPKQGTRAQLAAYVESELKAIDPLLAAPKANEYGRADRAADWALQARLYLNDTIYTGTARWADALTYSKKVIDAGYSLIPNYPWLMLADNNLNTSEFIMTINYDGLKTQSYGGTTFLTHCPVGGTMTASNYGIGGGWAGYRTTKNLPNLFPDYTGTADKRAQFYTSGQSLDINDVTNFTNGFSVTKYRNVKRSGALGQSLDFSDIDFPIFRLPEMYLIYAEAFLRGGGGDLATATGYVNLIRERAYGGAAGDISPSNLTKDFLLDERARELYWEGFRRTDLVRYGKFTDATYLWPLKGGVASGTSVASFRRVFPIPSADISANTNLKQNPGY
jgi:starch-binding outer membrane protein, SusD/RagB family